MTGDRLTWFVLVVSDPPKRMALRAALPDPNMTTNLLHTILYLSNNYMMMVEVKRNDAS